MEHFLPLLQHRWYLVAAALIALYLVVKLIKSVVKWALVILIVAALFIYGSHYSAKIRSIGGEIANYSKDKAVSAMITQASQAHYQQNADGTYSIRTGSLELDGRLGSNEVHLFIKGRSLGAMKLDGRLQKFVSNMQQQASDGK